MSSRASRAEAWSGPLPGRSTAGVGSGFPGRAEPVDARTQLGRVLVGTGQLRTGRPSAGNRRPRDNDGILPVLAKAVREVENRVQRGQLERTRFQVIALLAREERARVKADTSMSEDTRDTQLKRLDGIATILAQTAAREPSLFSLLAEDAEVSDSARRLKREMQIAGGLEPDPEVDPQPAELDRRTQPSEQVVPQSVVAAQLANPFLAPDFSSAAARRNQERRLAGWELISAAAQRLRAPDPGRAVLHGAARAPAHPRLPDGLELMPHQARVVAAAAGGTGRSCSPTSRASARPPRHCWRRRPRTPTRCSAWCPNVVKTNWAREVALWTPRRTVTVIHGDGEDIDGFADIVVVNYEVLDRHVGWIGRPRLPRHGRRRGALHQEQEVPALPARPRDRRPDPAAGRAAADDGAHRYAADQRHRGLPRDLAVPRLDRGAEAAAPR